MSSPPQPATPKMQYTRLGKTGVKVSKICLGCMSYGSSKWQPWVLEEEPSLEVIKKAYDSGVNFFDTADVYSAGESERVLGVAIKKFGFPRSKIVVATKVHGTFQEGKPELFAVLYGKSPKEVEEHGLINQGGLSRKHIFDAVDASLRRLQLDYIDLYQIHRFDYNTPVEETMEALNDVVRSGRVRYIGASSMHAWQFQKMNNVAKERGWAQFVTMQNLYNVLYREEEREMIPYCLDAGVGMIPWSPLARGVLGRRPGADHTERSKTDKFQAFKQLSELDQQIVNRVWEVADKHKVTGSQVAVAWVLSKPVVSSPILGISNEDHLKDLIGALDVKLADEDVKYLEELYAPKKIVGFQ